MSSQVIMLMIAALVALVVALAFSRPLKSLAGILTGAIVGGVSAAFLNTVLAPFGVYVGINAFTLLIMGLLGLPGLIMLYLTNFML